MSTETAIWAGSSGRHYTFNIHPIRNGTIPQFLDVSGVYMFLRAIGPGKYESLYVGEAQSLQDRLNACAVNHDGFKRASRHGVTHIAAMRASSVDRVPIETDLRHGLNPVANRQGIPILGEFR